MRPVGTKNRFLLIIAAISVLVLFASGSLFWNAIWLNLGNLILVKKIHTSQADWSLPILRDGSEQVKNRLERNAAVASIIREIKKDQSPSVSNDELNGVLNELNRESFSYTELCSLVQKDSKKLDSYIFPVSNQLFKYNTSKLLGFSRISKSETAVNGFPIVLWWENSLQGTVNIPFAEYAKGELCYADHLVGVPVQLTIVNADPLFKRSYDISKSELNSFYQTYSNSPFLLDFQPLEAGKSPQERESCRTRYSFSLPDPAAIDLQLFPDNGECYLAFQTDNIQPDDVFLLLARYKSNGGAQSYLSFYYPGPNQGVSTGGYYPDWHFDAVLSDMPKGGTGSGMLLLKALNSKEDGSSIIDFVFLAKVGGN